MAKNVQKKVIIGTGITIGALAILVGLILLFKLLAAFLSIPLSRAELERSLKSIANESDTIPAYVIYGRLHIGDEKLDVSSVLREETKTGNVEEIFCVTGDKAYFIYTTYTDAYDWKIASIDLKSSTIHDCCVFSDVAEIYISEHYGDYSERTGYYYDNQIVLSDSRSVFVYDIATEETHQYEYDQYAFPVQKVSGESINNTLNLHLADAIHTFTLEDMASKSDGIAKIYALKNKLDWQKCSYLSGFFSSNTIEVVGEKIYYIASVRNWQGEPYAIILEYDLDYNEWIYVTNCFVGSDIHRYCYIVPEI